MHGILKQSKWEIADCQKGKTWGRPTQTWKLQEHPSADLDTLHQAKVKDCKWAQWLGRPTPPLGDPKVKTVLQVVLKILFIIPKHFVEGKYAKLN